MFLWIGEWFQCSYPHMLDIYHNLGMLNATNTPNCIYSSSKIAITFPKYLGFGSWMRVTCSSILVWTCNFPLSGISPCRVSSSFPSKYNSWSWDVFSLIYFLKLNESCNLPIFRAFTMQSFVYPSIKVQYLKLRCVNHWLSFLKLNGSCNVPSNLFLPTTEPNGCQCDCFYFSTLKGIGVAAVEI